MDDYLKVLLKSFFRGLLATLIPVLIATVVFMIQISIAVPKDQRIFDSCMTTWLVDNNTGEIQSATYQKREVFLNSLLTNLKTTILTHSTYFIIKLSAVAMYFSMVIGLLNLLTQFVLYRFGIKPWRGTSVKTALFEKNSIIFGVFSVIVIGIIMWISWVVYGKKILDYPGVWLWLATAPFLLWVSHQSINRYINFRATSPGGAQKYMIVNGALTSLSCLVFMWFLVLLPNNFLPTLLNIRDSEIKKDVTQYAELQLGGSLELEVGTSPKKQIGSCLDIAVTTNIFDKHQTSFEAFKWHSIKIGYLAWYVILAAPMCAFQYRRRPHHAFYIYGALAALIAMAFEAISDLFVRDIKLQKNMQFLIALTSVGVGYYVSLLFDILLKHKNDSDD